MADERNLYERLDVIEAQNTEILRMVSESPQQPQPTKQQVTEATNESDNEILQRFLKQATKCWMWLGNESLFRKYKKIVIISLIVLIVMGLATTIITSFSCGIYSTFTAFENIWMIFSVACLVHAAKSERIYEVNELASHSSIKFEKDSLGMMFPIREKIPFKLFRWFAYIAVILNIIFIWTKPGDISMLATIIEALFLGIIIFSHLMHNYLFDQYAIIYVEGYSFSTNEKIVLVYPPNGNGLVTEEEFKKMMPKLYE